MLVARVRGCPTPTPASASLLAHAVEALGGQERPGFACDPRSAEGVKKAYAKVDWKTIFDESGIQFMPFNTLFQLASEAADRLSQAEFLMLIGDGFNYFLSGVAKAEEWIAEHRASFIIPAPNNGLNV